MGKKTSLKIKEIFLPNVKEIIARRAGYRCSYPGCNKVLVGPGRNSDEFVTIAECSHIFSASPNGPRGQGGLSEEQLKRPENGICLCNNHHKIIDSKKGIKYPSALLIGFKTRHESLISAEVGEYLYPLNWINLIRIKKSNLFNEELLIHLGKMTHFYGEMGSGKSTICELLYSCLSQNIDNRWNKEGVYFLFEISMDNPVMQNIEIEIKDKMLTYCLDNLKYPFMPFEFYPIFLKNELVTEQDDIGIISKCFNLNRAFLKSFILNNTIDGITTKNYSIKSLRKKPYEVDELFVNVGKKEQQSFNTCSSSETGRVLLDIGITLAQKMGKMKSVLLMIDWINIDSLDSEWFDDYLNYFTSPNTRFQTIFISPDKMNKINWTGWEIAKFDSHAPSTKIFQDKL